MKIRELLSWGEQHIQDAFKEVNVAKLLLMYVLKIRPHEVLLIMDDECSLELENQYKFAVKQYVDEGVPSQHIIGTETFFGYDFKVNEHVLIPRFETEELVEKVLLKYDELFQGEKVDVVDIGTGSGAIAITLDLEEANMKVQASDISYEALEVAKENNVTLNANVIFKQGDMLEPFIGNKKFDILVSNPPYIPSEEFVEDLVKENEPHVALFGGTDGLKFYKVILSNARKILKDKFIIAFEHAYNTGVKINELAREYFPDAEVSLVKDLQGKDRFTFVVKK